MVSNLALYLSFSEWRRGKHGSERVTVVWCRLRAFSPPRSVTTGWRQCCSGPSRWRRRCGDSGSPCSWNSQEKHRQSSCRHRYPPQLSTAHTVSQHNCSVIWQLVVRHRQASLTSWTVSRPYSKSAQPPAIWQLVVRHHYSPERSVDHSVSQPNHWAKPWSVYITLTHNSKWNEDCLLAHSEVHVCL